MHDHDPILRVEVSRYKGVYNNGAREGWLAEISIDGIKYSLGYYEEEEKKLQWLMPRQWSNTEIRETKYNRILLSLV